ncbi:flavin-dependent quinone reductase [Aspergillus puulaauensis]|uniref:NADPH-dependent FMN reductase-like domain-containing protein n=1 Tax=Aspergillus puulaauensis TaxID=1220207 RepID=A0A7R7XA89_9EURO|nr:uncharacterized protein APUU_10474S [Aspergillus puulaauensis]BCS17646.1 hypothetical protein APUU_10474S [Aspergillus puulaauensis]
MPVMKVALVTCSTREPRINPFITKYVHDIIQEDWSDKDTNNEKSKEINLFIIDLRNQNLPLYNEAAIPSHLSSTDPTPQYTHAHTRAWSALVRQYDAFIFVTPQYNWSIPASLKNALDYLFYEWKGKPAGIVTYGGRGGGKAGDHLRGVLTGLRMRAVETAPGIVVQGTVMEGCLDRGEVSMEDREAWRSGGVEDAIREMFRELLNELLEQ